MYILCGCIYINYVRCMAVWETKVFKINPLSQNLLSSCKFQFEEFTKKVLPRYELINLFDSTFNVPFENYLVFSFFVVLKLTKVYEMKEGRKTVEGGRWEEELKKEGEYVLNKNLIVKQLYFVCGFWFSILSLFHHSFSIILHF